jgi:hypothetical protein
MYIGVGKKGTLGISGFVLQSSANRGYFFEMRLSSMARLRHSTIGGVVEFKFRTSYSERSTMKVFDFRPFRLYMIISIERI